MHYFDNRVPRVLYGAEPRAIFRGSARPRSQNRVSTFGKIKLRKGILWSRFWFCWGRRDHEKIYRLFSVFFLCLHVNSKNSLTQQYCNRVHAISMLIASEDREGQGAGNGESAINSWFGAVVPSSVEVEEDGSVPVGLVASAEVLVWLGVPWWVS